MDKQDIVEFFIAHERLLTPVALEKLVQAEELNNVSMEPKLILDAGDVRTTKTLRILKKFESSPTVSVSDIAQRYNRKYEVMKNIIVERTKHNFVSINNLPPFGEFYTIGIIRNVYDKNNRVFFEIEDATGSATISFDPNKTELENIDVDDVAGFAGVIRNRILFGQQIILPDLPLRPPTVGYGRVCCMSDLNLDEAPTKDLEKMLQWLSRSNTDYVFIVGKIGDFNLLEQLVSKNITNKTIFLVVSDDGFPAAARVLKQDNIISLDNPSLIELNGVKILLSSEANVLALKKRYLGKTNVPHDALILDQIPDIIIYSGGHPFVENYKSVTLVNAGSTLTQFLPYVINLGNREYGQIYIDKIK